MAVVLAIDAGTTSVRTIAVNEGGAVVDSAQQEFTQHFPRPGLVEHDAVEIWEAVAGTLAEVRGRLDEAGTSIAAVGITNQRETIVAWSADTRGRRAAESTEPPTSWPGPHAGPRAGSHAARASR